MAELGFVVSGLTTLFRRNAGFASAWAVFSACVFSTAGAVAQSPSDRALAESLFHEGRRLLEAGDAEAACPKFAESHRIAPALGALLNLATCHERVGRTASAWVEFSEAATLARRLGQTARERLATERADALEPDLSRLTLVVAGQTPDLAVELDGKAIGSGAWGTPVPVDPGEHEVRAGAPGKKPWQTRVTVPKGPTTITVSVPELVRAADADVAPVAPVVASAAAPATARPESPPAPGDSGSEGTSSAASTTWIWVSGGIAAVGVGSGIYFGLKTFAEKETVDQYCDSDSCSDPRGLAAEQRAYDAATLSTVSFSVGLAASGVLVYLLLTQSNDSEPSRRVEVFPTFGESSVGVSSALRF